VVAVPTNSNKAYKQRFILGMLRIVFAITSICFFLFFFSEEAENIEYLQVINQNLDNSRELAFLFKDLNDQRRTAIIGLLYYENSSNTDYWDKYMNLYNQVESRLSVVETAIENDPDNRYVSALPEISVEKTLPQYVASLSQPCEFYINHSFSLLFELVVYWDESCETESVDNNHIILTDLSAAAYLSFFTLRVDIALCLSNFTSTNYSGAEMVKLYYGAKFYQDYFYRKLYRYYPPDQIDLILTVGGSQPAIDAISRVQNVLDTIEQTYLLDPDKILAEITTQELLDDSNTLLNSWTASDYVLDRPSNSDITARFAVSLIGTIFEMITALMLIWLAIPVCKLIYAFHSSNTSDRSEKSGTATSSGHINNTTTTD